MKVNIDFRDEMIEWIRDYGISILYQRSSRYIKCSCVDPLYKAPDAKCKICNGTGKKIKIEKLKILDQEMYPPNRKNQVGYSQVGQIYTPQLNFYFVTEDVPRIKDIVYIVGWKGSKPINLQQVYEINSIQAFRGDDGRIEFYLAVSTARPDLMSKSQEYIDRLRRL